MSLFSRIKEYFTPKVIFVGQSELSNPKAHRVKKEKKWNKGHYEALFTLSKITREITSYDFSRICSVHSADRRLNELKQWGYANARTTIDNEGHKRMHYIISELGKQKLYEKETL